MTKRLATQLMTLGAGLALAGAACTVNSTDVPSLTGPSEMALSFLVNATPDSITQDGVSQSSIVVTVKNASGQAAAGVAFRLDMLVGGTPVDYGRLSGKTVVTGSDGRATAVYTAPPPVAAGGDTGYCSPSIFSPYLPGTCVTISATPIGTGFFAGVNSQTVEIHLVPLGVILPPADTPTASFVVTPTPVIANVATNFDASSSCGGQVTNGSCSSGNVIVSYQWGFGDGATATGKGTSHVFTSAGTYTVSLTVTNDGGKSASSTQSVSVGASASPSANFVFSPSSPVVNQQIQFNAATSQAAPGRTLVRWDWNWGDGESGTGQTQDHDYTAAGIYNVVLTVFDDTGNRGTVTRTVTVGAGNPVASLVVSKTGGLSISADARGSSAASGATIATYSYSWGDTTSTSPGLSVQPKIYGAGGTYTITLTVVDNFGRASTANQNVTVP